ncbi:MAG: NACHT domain-containing protein [Anaerolineales bacterium]|nr:NACHT domain-containing protein [Anaerolineales bacterium]
MSSLRAEPELRARPTSALLRTKLVPPTLRPEHVPRPHLLARLGQSLVRPFTLLSAPIGSGKTTLLAEWYNARKQTRPLSLQPLWLTLDENDNDPRRLLNYLCMAFGAEAEGADELLNFLAERPQAFVLILDDYQTLTSPAAAAFMARLIERLPAHGHVCLLTRADPALPLAQWRARGLLSEWRTPELRFTRPEIEQFFQHALARPLDAETLAQLEASTEGWVAGLQLAALALQTQAKATFNGQHRFVADYFTEQVLSQLPPEKQNFLFETAVLEKLTAPLCEAVSGHAAQTVLEELERNNLFLVALDDERGWFRYHKLFREFLRARLKLTAPQRQAELHRRAAAWLEQNGQLLDSVEHVLASGEAEQAAQLMEQMAETLWRTGHMGRLLRWLEALPAAVLQTRPRLLILHAWMLNITSGVEHAATRLAEAERAAQTITHEAERRHLHGEALATRGILAVTAGAEADAHAFSQQALEILPEGSSLWRCVALRNVGNAHWLAGNTQQAQNVLQAANALSRASENVYFTLVTQYELAELALLRGQLHEAMRLCHQALAEVPEDPELTLVGGLHFALGAVLYEWNQLEESRQHFVAGLEHAERSRSVGLRVCGYVRLARAEWALGRKEAALATFNRAAALTPPGPARPVSFLPHLDVQAQLWAWFPDEARAQLWLNASQTPAPPYAQEAQALARARRLLLQQQPSAALALAHQWRPIAERGGRVSRVLETWVLEALAHQLNQRPAAARAALEKALALGEPEGFQRQFLDHGEALAALLTTRPGPAAQLTYGAQLLSAFNGRASTQTAHERLSVRELEVLKLMASGLSTQKIAQQLVVAPSTVQTHLKHLYSKLDAHSRAQAIARARELGLV